MATPRINSSPSYRLTIPELSGGINMRDGISLINDNQLTRASNVWYKNGMLQTRPGFVAEWDNLRDKDASPSQRPLKIYADEKNFRVIDGDTYFLVCLQYDKELIFRYYKDSKNYKALCTITDVPKNNGDYHCNIFQYNNEVYCFCSGYYEGETTPYYIFKIDIDASIDERIKRITDEDMYVPTVLTNIFPLRDDRENDGFANATSFEGQNLIGEYYKAIYSTTYAQNTISSTSNKMIYKLPIGLVADGVDYDYTNKNVVAEWIDAMGVEHKHSVVLDGGTAPQYESTSDDNYIMAVIPYIAPTSYSDPSSWVGATSYVFFFEKDGFSFENNIYKGKPFETAASLLTSQHVLNNLTITAPCPNSAENYKKILNMTTNEWYGGGSEGIYGGIHLFMAGNTEEKEKALVCWSDFNKPLYFSENAYAYAGDKSQKTTALAKQGESLFIFKERELFATKYVTNDTASASELENQSIIDLPANEVVFPMIQVHGYIGCDCPNTVKLCRNRLVWAHSDGKVYTLTSASQYNERSIFEVSAMIERGLKEKDREALKNAMAVDWDNKYVLIVNDGTRGGIYLMDYDSYGYVNVSSYNKNEDAQVRIPWWIWDIPEYNLYTTNGDAITQGRVCCDIARAVSIGGRFFTVCLFESAAVGYGNHRIVKMLEVKGNKDIMPKFIADGTDDYTCDETDKIEIPSMLQTKFFDFGTPTTKKTVPKIEVALGANDGVPITVSVITENNTTESEITLSLSSAEQYSPTQFENVLIRPEQKNNCRLAIKFESKGNIAVDAIALQYRHTGGLK